VKLLISPAPSLLVEPFRVTSFAYFYRGIHEDFDEVSLFHGPADPVSIDPIRADKRGDCHYARVTEEPGHGADPPDILFPVLGGKPKADLACASGLVEDASDLTGRAIRSPYAQ